MEINLNNRLDPITQQCEWANKWDTAQRVAGIAMPWLALHGKTNALLTLSNSVLTAGVHIKQLKICFANGCKARDFIDPSFKLAMCISQVGLQIFCPQLMTVASSISHGYQIIILTKDGIILLKDHKWKQALLCGGKILSSSLFIASSLHGGHLILALSLTMQGASELLFALNLLRESKASKLDYIEALSNIALGTMRFYQAQDHACTFYRNRYGHHLSQNEIDELFAKLDTQGRDAKQSDLDCLDHDKDQFDLEKYLKKHNISSELKDLDFSRLEIIEDVAFKNLEFIRCSFDKLDIYDCIFDHSRFSESHFIDVWGEDNTFSNITFDRCLFQNSRLLNSFWKNVTFQNSIIAKSALADSAFRNVKFLFSDLTESYFNGSNFTDTTFDGCNLNGSVFFEAQAQNSTFIDSQLIDTLLCDSATQFSFEGKTVWEITKPVIAYSSDPYENLTWGDLTDPVVDALRRSGALVLMFNHEPCSINNIKLRQEIQQMLPNLLPHKDKSIPVQLFENAASDSEIAKIQNITSNVIKWSDGLCIPGGADVEPALYDCLSHYPTWEDYTQDMMEAGAIINAMHDAKPILGICRGAQITAVVAGGTLKNVENQYGFATFNTVPEIGTKEHKLFEAIYGDTHVGGISMHGQAIDRIPEGFSVLAEIDDVPKLTTNADGSILLSQFHPEQYIPLKDSNHLQNTIDWDWIYEKFGNNPKIIAQIKAFIGSIKIPQQEDIGKWKRFFDYYVGKASEYRRQIAAAA